MNAYYNKKCSECGTDVIGNDAFCSNCGMQIIKTASQPAAALPVLPLQPDLQKPARNPVNPLIYVLAAACAVFFGIGLFFFLSLNTGSGANPQPVPAVTPPPVNQPQPTPEINPTPTPVTQPQPVEVTSVVIAYGDKALSDLTLMEGETITLSAIIEPFDAEAGISWVSGNSRVFYVEPAGTDGSIATLGGLSAGNTTLTVIAGNIIETCVIRVHEMTAPPPLPSPQQPPSGTLLRELYDGLRDNQATMQIFFSWTDGPFKGQTTELIGSSGSQWMMYGASGNDRRVYPEFAYDGNAYLISWSNAKRRYYLFENGTGYFAEPNGNGRENLYWEFNRWS